MGLKTELGLGRWRVQSPMSRVTLFLGPKHTYVLFFSNGKAMRGSLETFCTGFGRSNIFPCFKDPSIWKISGTFCLTKWNTNVRNYTNLKFIINKWSTSFFYWLRDLNSQPQSCNSKHLPLCHELVLWIHNSKKQQILQL